MLETNLEILEKDDPASTAFVFYTPPHLKAREKIFFNQEASRILSMLDPANTEEKFNLQIISSFCTNWHKILQSKIIDNSVDESDAGSSAIYLDIIQSYRRRYAVKGVVLSTLMANKSNRSYIFILERFVPEDINLLKIFRKYHLSSREQEIVRLLLLGEGNKQIAYSLGLSINTIKSYMKLLMKKLGVSNRSGIISTLLMDK